MTLDTSWEAIAAAVGMCAALCSLAALGWLGAAEPMETEDES